MNRQPIYIPGSKLEAASNKTDKELEREHIEAETRRFLNAGGKITTCEFGETGDPALKRMKVNNLRGMRNL